MDEVALAEHRNDVNMMALDIRPGEMCAHQVFQSPAALNLKATELLKAIPPFHRKSNAAPGAKPSAA